MNLRLVLVVVLALGCAPLGAAAQTIYRCGTNEYTRVPCPDGRPLDLGDSRSAAQRAEARRILAEEQKRGREMERDRRRDEAAVKPAGPASLGPAPAASAASAPKKASSKGKRRKAEADDERDFVARAPAPSKKASAP